MIPIHRPSYAALKRIHERHVLQGRNIHWWQLFGWTFVKWQWSEHPLLKV